MTKGFNSHLQADHLKRTKTSDRQPVASVQSIQEKLCEYVSEIPDPRVPRSQKHQLQDILVIAILAVIAGAFMLGRLRKLRISQTVLVVNFSRTTQRHP